MIKLTKEKVSQWIKKLFTKLFKKQKKETKRPPVTRHAQKRLEERHGTIFKDKMAMALVQSIKSGNARLLKETRDNASEWVVIYEKKRYRVIYNNKKEIIITVYPGWKDKRRKPRKRKKMKTPTGRSQKKHSYKAKRNYKVKGNSYKRNNRVKYEEDHL